MVLALDGKCRDCRGGGDVRWDGEVRVQHFRDGPVGAEGKKKGKGDGGCGCCEVM